MNEHKEVLLRLKKEKEKHYPTNLIKNLREFLSLWGDPLVFPSTIVYPLRNKNAATYISLHFEYDLFDVGDFVVVWVCLPQVLFDSEGGFSDWQTPNTAVPSHGVGAVSHEVNYAVVEGDTMRITPAGTHSDTWNKENMMRGSVII